MAAHEVDPWSLDAIVSEAENVAFKEQQQAEERARNEAIERKNAEQQAARQAKAKLFAEQESSIQAELDELKRAEDDLFDIQEKLPDAQGQARKELKQQLISVDKLAKKLRGALSKDARKRYASAASAAASNPKDLSAFDDPEKDAAMEKQLKEEQAASAIEAARERQIAEEKAAYEAMKAKQAEALAKKESEEEERELMLKKKRERGEMNLFDEDRPQTNDSEYTDRDIVDDYLLSALRIKDEGTKGGSRPGSVHGDRDEADEYAEDPQMQTLRSYVRRKSMAEENGQGFGFLQRKEKEKPKEPETCMEKFLACYCCKCIQKPAVKLTKWKPFNNTVLILILLNCLSLSLYEPDKEEDEGRNVILNILDKAFTALFTIEMLIKWVARGLGPYFQDGWNILDFTCVMVGLLAFVPGAALGNFSGLRSVRALRPLRTLNAVPGIKMLVGTIFNAAPLLRDVLLLILFLLFLFAIVALQFFSGTLKKVCMSSITGSAQGVGSVAGNPVVCQEGTCGAGYTCTKTGMNPQWGMLNFDNAGASMLTIFVVMTQDRWVDVMYDIMEVTESYAFMYFVMIILFLCIISINLIAAILASRFGLLRVDHEQRVEMENRLKMEDDKPDLMAAVANAQEIAKVSVDGEVATIKDERSCCDKFRFPFYQLVTKGWFIDTSGVFILVYCLSLTLKHSGQPAIFDDILNYSDMGFSAIFMIELLLKLLGYPLGEYFSSAFNVFDSTIVLFCFVDVWVIGFISDSVAVLRVFRVFRVFQASRLLARFKQFWRVVGSIEHTLDSALWFNLVLFLVVFIYTLLSMQLFGTIDFSDINNAANAAPDYEDTNTRWSFSTFLRAFISIFVMLTGRWTTIGFYTAYESSPVYILLWVSLMAIGNFVMLNLLLAVLIDSIRANADKVERQNGKLMAQARKREEHKRNMKGLCRRLNQIGMSGTLLGDFADREAELYTEDEPPQSPQSPLAIKDSAASSRVHPESKYDVTDDYDPKAEDERDDVLFINSSRPGSIRKQDMVEEVNPVIKATQPAKGGDSLHLLDLALGAEQPTLPGTPQESPATSARQLSARVAPEDDVTTTTSASAPGRGSGSGYQTCQPCRQEEGMLAGDPVSSEVGAGVGASIAGAPKKKKKKKKKDMNLSVFRYLPFGYLLPCVHRPEKARPPEKLSTEVDESSVEFDPEEKSLFCFLPDSCIRKYAIKLMQATWFEGFIISLILLNCVTLPLDSPGLDEDSTLAKVLGYVDYFFNAMFIWECGTKIVALGFYWTEHGYLKTGWNRLDFIIVIFSIINMAITSSSLKALRAMRALRALRPLRLISRLKGLKVVFDTLLVCLPAMWNVFLVALALWLLFAIMGLHMFCGTFSYCSDYLDYTARYETDRVDCVGSYVNSNGATVERSWETSDYNFDNLGAALKTMFVVATLDGWESIMWLAIDANKVDEAPMHDNNLAMAFFFIAFIVAGSFFATSLFVGEIVHAYSKISDEEGLMLTEDEKEWVVAVRMKMDMDREAKEKEAASKNQPEDEVPEMLPPTEYYPSEEQCGCCMGLRIKIYHLVMTSVFENSVIFAILANMLVLAVEYDTMSSEFEDLLTIVNLGFTIFFGAEMLLKLLGFGIEQYLSDAWNILDGSVVIATLVGLGLGSGGFVSLLRSLRVLRLVRLLKGVAGLRSLMSTLFMSLPSLGNVGLLMMLLFYIFAVLGMSLFGNVQRQTYLNDEANFESFPMALLTLIRVLTFDGWSGLMEDCMRDMPGCDADPDNSACGDVLAAPFFIMYLLFGNFLMLNVFTAIILLNFKDAAMDEGLAGEGFMSMAMFKMNQLDAYMSEFQRRYRVYRRRQEKPVWLYTTTDHSFNRQWCAICNSIPCLDQRYDDNLEALVSPHYDGVRPGTAPMEQAPEEEEQAVSESTLLVEANTE